MAPPRVVVRLLVASALLLLGAAVAVCAVALHNRWWGLALGLAATAAALGALPGGWWRRTAFGVGWVVALGLLSVERPEGDYLVAAEASGYVLLAAGLVVLVVAVVSVRERPRRRAEDSEVVGTAS